TAQDALLAEEPAAAGEAPRRSRARDWAAARGWTTFPEDLLLERLDRVWQACEEAGIDVDDDLLDRYAEAMEQVARLDVDTVPTGPEGAVHRVIVGTVMLEPVLLALRLLARRELSLREAGGSAAPWSGASPTTGADAPRGPLRGAGPLSTACRAARPAAAPRAGAGRAASAVPAAARVRARAAARGSARAAWWAARPAARWAGPWAAASAAGRAASWAARSAGAGSLRPTGARERGGRRDRAGCRSWWVLPQGVGATVRLGRRGAAPAARRARTLSPRASVIWSGTSSVGRFEAEPASAPVDQVDREMGVAPVGELLAAHPEVQRGRTAARQRHLDVAHPHVRVPGEEVHLGEAHGGGGVAAAAGLVEHQRSVAVDQALDLHEGGLREGDAGEVLTLDRRLHLEHVVPCGGLRQARGRWLSGLRGGTGAVRRRGGGGLAHLSFLQEGRRSRPGADDGFAVTHVTTIRPARRRAGRGGSRLVGWNTVTSAAPASRSARSSTATGSPTPPRSR